MTRKYCKWTTTDSGRYKCNYTDGECARLKAEDPYGRKCSYIDLTTVYCKFCEKPAVYTFSHFQSWSSITFEDFQTSVCSITCGLKMDLPAKFRDSTPRETFIIYKIKDSKYYLSLDADEATILLSILKQKETPYPAMYEEECVFCGKSALYTHELNDDCDEEAVCNNIVCLIQLPEKTPKGAYLSIRNNDADFLFKGECLDMFLRVVRDFHNETRTQ